MSFQRRILIGVVCAALGVCATTTSAQFLVDFYTLVDAGPVAVPACPCISTPFRLPSYRPVTIQVSGLERERYLAERQRIARDVEAGLGGDEASSMSVAVHLSDHPLFAPADAATEDATVRWLHLAAQQGSPGAFYLLAYRYRQGLGVEQNDAAAAYWFHKDAVRGSNIGMVALGLLYAAGRGVPQDWNAAVYWWRKAEPSHALATRFLGDAYVCGVGVRADNARALAAYKRAAQKAEISASIQLGHMYANGCAPPDDEAAVKAYMNAAAEGYPEAEVALSELMLAGRGGSGSGPAAAYHWARLAERRQPSGEWSTRAAAAAKAAARLLSPDERAATDQMVDQIIAGSSGAR